MASIVMADDGVAFDGTTAEAGPLGGAETAFVALAEAFAGRGHRVEARSRCPAPVQHGGVNWAPLASGTPASCDLYIGNRGYTVMGLSPGARRRLFWLHNPAGYLRKPRNAMRLAWYRPIVVTTSLYHAQTLPQWLPRGGHAVIPYGILDCFRHAESRQPPPPRALFTSNPLRGLDWLVDHWVMRIKPAVPQAELHIYAGPSVYGGIRDERVRQMEAVLAKAEGARDSGVQRHLPVGRDALVNLLAASRAMLYRGDLGETFCLAVAEAQAMGVPAVVRPLGSLGERVNDGISGRVAPDDDAFVAAAIAVLRDDDVWRRWHHGALDTQRGLGWDEVASRFEAFLE